MSGPRLQRADDCERMARILADAPVDGLSLDEIQEITKKGGETWSLSFINDVLCDLRMNKNAIGCHKIRNKRGGKVTKYFIKSNN